MIPRTAWTYMWMAVSEEAQISSEHSLLVIDCCILQGSSTCLLVCLFACLLVCLFACLLVCLFACLHVCMFACLHVCLFACLLVCLFACLPAYGIGLLCAGANAVLIGRPI